MRKVTLATTQFACTWDREENIATADRLVRQAAREGANVVLLQELFETPYFCAVQKRSFLALAQPLDQHPTVEHFARLAKELGVVIPVSIYERAGNALFNSAVILDADGSRVGHYRKSHIPQAPGYEEKFYFSRGDTGLKPVKTAFGTLGLAICWDQWFPEAARALVLQGAEFLMYPTAIGCEPNNPEVDSMEHWRNVMRGHAGANMVPVLAANRIGTEITGEVTMQFYGSSFIAGHRAELVREAPRSAEAVLVATFDLDACQVDRLAWGCFRDRRPELYGSLMTLDGTVMADNTRR
jgi:N-carbamoylputrescine amidase